MNDGFIWKDIHSNEMGLKILKLPSISTSTIRDEKIEIQGRHGYLTITDNTFEGDIKIVEYDVFKYELDVLKKWLTGYGKVIFSNESDRYYKARIINKISLDQVLPYIHGGIVEFDCQPFGYLLEGEEMITINSPVTIYNLGNYDSEPYLKVYGSGNVTLIINDESIQIKNLEEYIEIDSEIDCFYKGNVSLEDKVNGDVPKFIEGNNQIKWIGNIDRIEVIPRWRKI